MSLPKSRILSTTKGFSAAAELHNNSPEQNTVVNVNVNHSPEPKETTTTTIERPQTPAPTLPTPINDPNPYATIEPGQVQYVQERSVDTAKESLTELQQLIHSKDNIINAYSLMLDIVENNPLIVNRYVVADINSLTELISNLTEGERVDIQEALDVDCSCVGSVKYVPIDKIFITKNGETLNFKYSFPDANKILDEHHISVKLVIDKTVQ